MKDDKNQHSYDEGYKEGYDKGLGDGQNKGYEKGYRIGMDIGSNKGYKEGYEYGFEKGYREGYNLGYNMGFLAGLKEKDVRYHQGYEIGYQKGFDSAFNKLSNFTGRLIDSGEVYTLIKKAYLERKDFSLVCLSHMDILRLEKQGYANREFIEEVLKKASVIGLPTSHIPEYQLYLLDSLEKEGLKLGELIITDANIGYALLVNMDFIGMLRKEKINLGTLLNQGERSFKDHRIQGLNIWTEVQLGDDLQESKEARECFSDCRVVLNFCGLKGIKYLWNHNYSHKLIILDLGEDVECLMERITDVYDEG